MKGWRAWIGPGVGEAGNRTPVAAVGIPPRLYHQATPFVHGWQCRIFLAGSKSHTPFWCKTQHDHLQGYCQLYCYTVNSKSNTDTLYKTVNALLIVNLLCAFQLWFLIHTGSHPLHTFTKRKSTESSQHIELHHTEVNWLQQGTLLKQVMKWWSDGISSLHSIT